MQTCQDNMQAFLAAVGAMVQYAREDEAVQLQTVSSTFPHFLFCFAPSHNLGNHGESLEVPITKVPHRLGPLSGKLQACMSSKKWVPIGHFGGAGAGGGGRWVGAAGELVGVLTRGLVTFTRHLNVGAHPLRMHKGHSIRTKQPIG